jgi:hypothetical protein
VTGEPEHPAVDERDEPGRWVRSAYHMGVLDYNELLHGDDRPLVFAPGDKLRPSVPPTIGGVSLDSLRAEMFPTPANSPGYPLAKPKPESTRAERLASVERETPTVDDPATVHEKIAAAYQWGQFDLLDVLAGRALYGERGEHHRPADDQSPAVGGVPLDLLRHDSTVSPRRRTEFAASLARRHQIDELERVLGDFADGYGDAGPDRYSVDRLNWLRSAVALHLTLPGKADD